MTHVRMSSTLAASNVRNRTDFSTDIIKKYTVTCLRIACWYFPTLH
jgi:hypothetical protein